MWKNLSLLALTFLLDGCASNFSASNFRPNERPEIVDSLYFGTSKPGGLLVKPNEWRRFLAEVVTPRFPKGITSWMAAGQWQNSAGKIEQEESHVLLVVHPDSSQADERIREIISIYKRRFAQEAVLRIRSSGGISL